MTYRPGVTTVETTATQALASGQGVCQDYAHIMLALCRLCGLPARYVSGHLLGEGGTHAWVDVLLPGRPQESVAMAFDPTHGREAGLSYVTVAVGRDYRDVAPTSGTYRASHKGRLSSERRVGLTAVQYTRRRRTLPKAGVDTA
jgi:transglutaminase-like putative cysteine protease